MAWPLLPCPLLLSVCSRHSCLIPLRVPLWCPQVSCLTCWLYCGFLVHIFWVLLLGPYRRPFFLRLDWTHIEVKRNDALVFCFLMSLPPKVLFAKFQLHFSPLALSDPPIDEVTIGSQYTAILSFGLSHVWVSCSVLFSWWSFHGKKNLHSRSLVLSVSNLVGTFVEWLSKLWLLLCERKQPHCLFQVQTCTFHLCFATCSPSSSDLLIHWHFPPVIGSPSLFLHKGFVLNGNPVCILRSF